ncbi:MAG: hypothetical protein ACRC7N_20840 [Clostridium sp.]
MRIHKVNKVILTLVFILISIPSAYVKADTIQSEIILDGKFEDWSGKPIIKDKTGDAPKSKDDLIELRYYTNEEYIYVYLEREHPQGKEEWDSQVVFLNGKGSTDEHYIPWENEGVSPHEWKGSYYTTVKINVNFEYWPKEQFRVQLKLGGENIETTYSSSPDGKKIEFRVPLKSIGLDGQGQEIKMAVKSPPEAYHPNIDWIGDNGPIIITPGPIFGSLTGLVVLMSVGSVAYIVYRR